MVDDSQIPAGIKAFTEALTAAIPSALMLTADAVHIDSDKQVPFDTGWLQGSGLVEMIGVNPVLGYHAPYAAYQHEGVRADGSHIVKNWQNGRNKKYISDPLTNNAERYLGVFGGNIAGRIMP